MGLGNDTDNNFVIVRPILTEAVCFQYTSLPASLFIHSSFHSLILQALNGTGDAVVRKTGMIHVFMETNKGIYHLKIGVLRL